MHLFVVSLLLPANRIGFRRCRTLLGRQLLQIDLDTEIIALLRAYNIRAILSLQHVLRTILHKLRKALDSYRYHHLALRFRSGDVEGNAVEIGHDLVN